MTTLAANKPRTWEIGDQGHYPIIGNDIVFGGAAVGDNGAGLARPLVGGDRFLGFAIDRVDNTGGAASALMVPVKRRGAAQLAVSGAVASDVGQPVYAVDDDTFTLLPTGGSYIGRIRRVESAGIVIVEFDCDVGVDPYGDTARQTVSGNVTLAATDSGKTLFVTADALTITLPAAEGLSGIKIVNAGAAGAILVTVAPNAADMIEGPGITAADNKAILNTKATARRGDFVTIDYSDANGWVIREMRGIWARAA
ncbi:MAG: hypothetical protein U1E83_01105 [Methylotetracoccus sp.]